MADCRQRRDHRVAHGRAGRGGERELIAVLWRLITGITVDSDIVLVRQISNPAVAVARHHYVRHR